MGVAFTVGVVLTIPDNNISVICSMVAIVIMAKHNSVGGRSLEYEWA